MADTCSVDTYAAGVWWVRAAVVLLLAAVSSSTALPPRAPVAALPEAVAEAVTEVAPEGGSEGGSEGSSEGGSEDAPGAPPVPLSGADEGAQGVRRGAGIFARPRQPLHTTPPRTVRRGVRLASALRRRGYQDAEPAAPAPPFAMGARGTEGKGVASGAPMVLRMPPSQLKHMAFKL